jgi:guanylate kinase
MEAGWILNRNLSYDFDPSNLPDAHFWCQRMTQRWMREGIDEIAVHNTFTTEKELEPYLDMAALFEYRVVSIVVENRHNGTSIHDVPESALQRQEVRIRNSLKLR